MGLSELLNLGKKPELNLKDFENVRRVTYDVQETRYDKIPVFTHFGSDPALKMGPYLQFRASSDKDLEELARETIKASTDYQQSGNLAYLVVEKSEESQDVYEVVGLSLKDHLLSTSLK